ncbi:glycoside hydrolase superfamily [Chytriomyces cf. hyalinus JEL632]|nr:glycoside hydrolase superfamily [Chytriomyces cf. hyalinus JEL632]
MLLIAIISMAQLGLALPACYTTWAPGAYTGGAKVSNKGSNYKANWWSDKEPSLDSAAWGAWTNEGPCETGAASSSVVPPTSASPKPSTTSVAPPTSSVAPSPTSSVAPSPTSVKPSTSSVPPASSQVPTTATSKTSSAVSPVPTSNLPVCWAPYSTYVFHPLVVYQPGNKVSYQGVNYIVAYQGAAGPPNAAAGSGWNSQGACQGTSFAYRPFVSPGMIGYWTQWSIYSRAQNTIDKVDLSGFTGINYAFVNLAANGQLVTFDDNADSKWLRGFTSVRDKYPNLRTIVSIGGWSGSQHFSTVAASDSLTQTFVKTVHTFLDTFGFDGVDLDWEYPSGGGLECNTVNDADPPNFVKLLAALRAELGPDRSISLAVSGETTAYIQKSTGINYIPEIFKYINYAQIMSYDFYGSWSSYADFNSPLNAPGPNDPVQPAANNNGYTQSLSHTSTVNAWIKAGAKASQLTNGIGFYGRSWSVGTGNATLPNNGLYNRCNSWDGTKCTAGSTTVGDYLDVKPWAPPASSTGKSCGTPYNSGVWMYLNMRGAGGQQGAPLASGPTSGSNGWNRQYFDFAQSPTVYTPKNFQNVPSFVSYDDPVSVKAKAAWAKQQKLGGTMVWELSQDYNNEMVNALRAGWGA